MMMMVRRQWMKIRAYKVKRKLRVVEQVRETEKKRKLIPSKPQPSVNGAVRFFLFVCSIDCWLLVQCMACVCASARNIEHQYYCTWHFY